MGETQTSNIIKKAIKPKIQAKKWSFFQLSCGKKKVKKI